MLYPPHFADQGQVYHAIVYPSYILPRQMLPCSLYDVQLQGEKPPQYRDISPNFQLWGTTVTTPFTD